MSLLVQIVLLTLDQITHTLVLVASWMLFVLISPKSARAVAKMALRSADKRLAEKASRNRP